jgi:hypothetical protein
MIDGRRESVVPAAPGAVPSAEPWGRRLWITLTAVVVVAACLLSYGISTWPMADDEVPSLVELGLLHIGAEKFFSVPADQIGKLPKATIVWNKTQRLALDLLPKREASFRLPSVVYGVLTSALVFMMAARWRGWRYALALSVLQNMSQPFVYLSQQNRFYGLPFLLLILAMGAMWLPRGGGSMILVTAVVTVLAVLSHNLTVAAFGLAFLAACPLYLLGRAPSPLLWRSGIAASISGLVYLFYLLPLVKGWNSTGNPTPVLISFAAHAGVPTLALAFFGLGLCVAYWRNEDVMLWWGLLFLGSLCLFVVMRNRWNPRYFLFFLPAVWVLAAHAVDFIARRLRDGLVTTAWYGCVAMLLLPNLASHYVDGSRHDYRQAAAVLIRYAQHAQPILSDDAETISYYLPADFRQRLQVRTKVRQFPTSEFFLVCRSNVWTPLPEARGRSMDLLAEIYRRRYDEFSHVLRVYRVAAGTEAEANVTQ